MSWYTVKLLFVSKIDGTLALDPHYEIKMVLVKAENDTMACEKGKSIGVKEVHSYKNHLGETIQWDFVRSFEPFIITESSLEEGVEVFGYTFHASEKSNPDNPDA